jgi:addiction module RelE/StbE family toxin
VWTTERKNQFKRQYKHLHSDIQKRVNEALVILAEEQNPAKPELHKTGNIKCLHVCPVGRQYRILYDVDFTKREIALIRVGTHDDVYNCFS